MDFNRLSHIEKLHSEGKAIKDKIYIDEDSIRYVGLKNGRVKKLDPVTGEITGDIKSSEVDKIGIHIRKNIITDLTQVTTNKNNISGLESRKANKGYAIAMSIILP